MGINLEVKSKRSRGSRANEDAKEEAESRVAKRLVNEADNSRRKVFMSANAEHDARLKSWLSYG